MKKRIIALILVAVLSVLTLAGCAYDYSKDSMDTYVTFDDAKFTEALKGIIIADGDFGVDEDVRWEKVEDYIFTALAKEADEDAKVTEGKPSQYDVYKYCYYCTAEIDGETVILFASNMKESSAVDIQLGLNSLEGLDKAIADKVKDKDIKDYIYKTETGEKTAKGDTVYISYTKEYSTDSTDESITVPKKVTVSYMEVTLPTDDGSSFLHKLIDKNVSTTITVDPMKETVDGTEFDVTYSNVKVNWVVESKTEIATVKDTTYTEKKEVADIYGVKHDLKDKELTYHIFPVYYLSVESELDADVVLRTLLGDAIKVSEDADEDGEIEDSERGSLACFDNEEYKNGDETLKTLVDKLADLQVTLTDAKKDVEDAQKAYDKAVKAVEDAGGADKATSAQNAAVTDTKKELDEAKTAEKEAQDAVDAQIEKIYGCHSDMKDIIVEDYRQSQYDELEKAYKSEIKENLAVKVYELAKKYITFKTDDEGIPILPRKAVDNAYDRMYNGYKYDFYEGDYSSTSSNKVSNYDKYEGDFDHFLKVELGFKESDDIMAAKHKIYANAEDSVRELIVVYKLAEFYGDAVKISDEDRETIKNQAEYYNYLFGEGAVLEEDFLHAKVLDNVFNYILEEKEDYEGNKVLYKLVEYKFDTETETE